MSSPTPERRQDSTTLYVTLTVVVLGILLLLSWIFRFPWG